MTRHGARASYLRGCRCDACSAANRRYGQLRAVRVLTDPQSLGVPVEQVMPHVQRVLATMSATAYADAAGVSSSTFARLGRQRRVRPATAARLLAVQPGGATGKHYVPATGSRRRVQALAAIGWPVAAVARRVGITRSNLAAIVAGDVDQVFAATAARISRVYDDLSMTLYRPADRWERAHRTRTLRTARDAGWAPPLAWDDDTIDDPAAAPQLGEDAPTVADDAVIARVLAGERCATTAADRAVLVPALAERRMSDTQIGHLCRCTARTIERDRRRLGVQSRWAA